MTIRSILWAAACVSTIASIGQAQAQAWPDKPVRIVVGLAAGGGTDIVARTLSPELAKGLGQSVIVENRTGASGGIAADFVAKSPADGYTFLLAPSSTLVSNVVMKRDLPYTSQDFTPVSMVGTFPMLLVVDADSPVKSLAELTSYIKANPGKANASGSGTNFELQAALLSQRLRLPITFIPYKGSNESVQALVAHDVLMTFVDIGPALGALKGNRVRALATTSPARLPDFADVPTFAELGIPELEAEYWMAVFAPSKTPAAIVERLHDEMRKALAKPEVKAALRNRWVDARSDSPAEVSQRIKTEVGKWNDVRTTAGIAQSD